MTDPNAFASAVQEVFEEIHRRVFLGDPAANPRLRVEVVDAISVNGVPTLILVTPWTLNGMFVADPERHLDQLDVGKKRLPVFINALDEVGVYGSVNLVPDVGKVGNQEEARRLAVEVGDKFRRALALAFEELEVPDPDRRRLLQGRVAT